MAFKFRYRYVDFQTVFTSDPGLRDAENGADSPSVLYANELVTDVGQTCWDRNEPMSVLDHHFERDGQFPSASAAVLHKAGLIRQKFGAQSSDTIWLVTHKDPDFDAFCSMYLARWLIEDANAPADWQPFGLHPQGCFDLPGRPAIDWLSPHFHAAPAEFAWALQLACYASILDSRRHLPCPRAYALHSVLYAALKRGRDYLSESSGATELFDAARAAMREKQLNPVFDSVLEDSQLFAPELQMLKREAEAYLRDVERARKAAIYLPESEAPSPDFFKSMPHVAPRGGRGKPPNATADHPTLSDTFRIPTDGIYLRDPECLLFREWARLDLDNSALGAGFEFTAIANSHGRPAGSKNKSDYSFSLDPERANGRHLYTVWSRLQTKEVEALRGFEADAVLRQRPKYGESASHLLSDPWLDGHEYFGTLIATPHRGTLIGRPGVRDDLRDDAVVEAVRTELENAIFLAETPTAGPQVTVCDFAGSISEIDSPARQFDLDAPESILPARSEHFRFAGVQLRPDVPIVPGGITRRGLAQQIADTLWQVLQPELPYDRLRHWDADAVVVTPDSVGLWSDRGIAVAYKHHASEADDSEPQAAYHIEGLQESLAAIVALARDAEEYVKEGQDVANATASPAPNALPAQPAVRGRELMRRAGEIQLLLALPGAELLRGFWDAIGAGQWLATVEHLSRSAEQTLLRDSIAADALTTAESAGKAGGLRSRLAWLEVLGVGFFAAAVLALSTARITNNGWATPFALLGGLCFLLIAAWLGKPWDSSHREAPDSRRLTWNLVLVLASYVVGLLFWWGFSR